MKFFRCVFVLMYVSQTVERNIRDLTQIKTISLDILTDNKLNSVNNVHNISRKVESVILNITTNIGNSSNDKQNSTKLQNETIAQTLQNSLKNVSLYEHVQNKTNDINERSFVFIDTKYKVPIHHQNMLRRGFAKTVDLLKEPLERMWDASLNYKEMPKNFLEDEYQEEPSKLYIDHYKNPNAPYGQPNNEEYFKAHMNMGLSKELIDLEKKVKAANAFIDYQYQDIANRANMLEKNTKDHIIVAQKHHEYPDYIKMPAIQPETIMMKNHRNKQYQTSDTSDRYKNYNSPYKKITNELRDNIFDHNEHQSEFHDNLQINKFEQPNIEDYFDTNIRTSDNNANRNNGMYVNKADLDSQHSLQSDEDDFDSKFDHNYPNNIIKPQINNIWMDKNRISHKYKYDHPIIDVNSESSFLKHVDNIGHADDTTNTGVDAQKSNTKYNQFSNQLQNNIKKPYFKGNTHIFKPNENVPEVPKNKPATNKQHENNVDQSRKNYYLKDKIHLNHMNQMKYRTNTEQANLKKKYSNDKINSGDPIPESLKNNYYLKEDRRNMKPNKPLTTDNGITQDESPTIEIQRPDSKNNYLTIKIKDNYYSGSSNRVSNDYMINKKPDNKNGQSISYQGNSIEIFPKLNEIYLPMKDNNLNYSTEAKLQHNIFNENEYKPMKLRIIDKPPPPDLSDNEVTMALQQKDNVFKHLSEKLDEINEGNSDEVQVTTVKTMKSHDDCMLNTLVRRITNKSVVVTQKPFRESCVYPECMEKAILNSDPNNPTCECEYAIKQNMSKNTDYGDLELPVPSHKTSSGRSSN